MALPRLFRHLGAVGAEEVWGDGEEGIGFTEDHLAAGIALVGPSVHPVRSHDQRWDFVTFCITYDAGMMRV